MLPEKMVKARLSFASSKHTQQPNVVIVPAAGTFPVPVEWSMESEESYIIGSHDPDDAHRWCVLDADLRPVMFGGAGRGPRIPKTAEPLVSRTLHGGGAGNPCHVTYEFASSKLKSGASYTLVASRHGVMAAGEFVAVAAPKRKAAAKKKAVPTKATPKKKAVPKQKAAPQRKAAVRKRAAARK